MEYGSRCLTRVPLLTPHDHHQTLRRAFATKYHSWTLQQWRNIIWLDESQYQLHHADRRHRVWCRPHESMDPACQEGVVPAGGVSVIVWGAFSLDGMGPLVVLEGTLNGLWYVELLGDNLHLFLVFQHPDGPVVFQNNALPHCSHVARE